MLMLESYVKPYTNRWLLEPVASFSIKNISSKPNLYTVWSGVCGILGCPAVYNGYIWFGILLFFISGFLDMLDGYVARKTGQSSPVGTVLDIVADRLVEFSIIFSIYLMDVESNGMYCLLMLGSVLVCVTSFLVVGMFSENNSEKSFYYSPGLIERSEAFLFFFIMLTAPASVPSVGGVFIFLVFLTTLIRLKQFIRQLEEEAQ